MDQNEYEKMFGLKNQEEKHKTNYKIQLKQWANQIIKFGTLVRAQNQRVKKRNLFNKAKAFQIKHGIF